jgi:hypothetical protein
MPNDKPVLDSNKEYFVEVQVTWGKQNGDTQKVESTGGQNWGYLTYDQAVAVQNAVVIPNLNQMLIDAGELGLEMVEDSSMADLIRAGNAAKKDK